MKEHLYAQTEINDKFDFGQLKDGEFYTVYYEKDSCPLVWSEWNIKRDFKLISYILLPIEVKTVSDEDVMAIINNNSWSECEFKRENTYKDKYNFLEINKRVVCEKIIALIRSLPLYEVSKEQIPPSGIFKRGDKITLNTGYSGDKGEVLVDYGNVVFWKDKDGNKYCSPRDNYNITLQK